MNTGVLNVPQTFEKMPNRNQNCRAYCKANSKIWDIKLFSKQRKKKKALIIQGFLFGGADGTRTRDPRRDRPVF
jgi:hypothetical protein